MTRPRPANQICAHRGASAFAPENTLSAFRAARDAGAGWVEFDVALLGDGTPVVIHDAAVDRCSSASAELSELTFEDLGGIDAGSWFHPRFSGERIPTLAQTLSLLSELGLSANLEIKWHAHQNSLETLVRAIYGQLREGPPLPQLVISSFEPEALDLITRLDPGYAVARLWDELPVDWARQLDSGLGAAIHLNYRRLSAALLDAARRSGTPVRAWTCNEPALIEPYWDMGLAGVITDDPRLYLDQG